MLGKSFRDFSSSVIFSVIVTAINLAYTEPKSIDIVLPEEEHPFQFVDDNGELKGFHVDIADALGEYSGYPVNIRIHNRSPHALRNMVFEDRV